MSESDPRYDSNKRLALDFIRLASENRTNDALALLHTDATWWVAGDPRRLRVAGLKNRADIDRLLHGMKKAIPGGMRMLIQGLIAEHDRVAVELEGEGLWRNGRRYHNHYHILFKVLDNRIVAVREYMDTLHLNDVSQD
jgi:ketosteroid isomerase-like protein